MQSTRKMGRQAASLRAAVSFVEFVGCMLALGGGLALGSMYLGVDMKSMAVSVLEQADIVDPALLGLTVDEKKPTASEQATVERNSATTTENTPEDTDRADETSDGGLTVVADRDVGAESVDATAEAGAEPAGVPVELTEQQRQVANRTYWKGLTRCIRDEAAGRNASIKNPSEWQLFDYLTHRKKGHEKAVELLERLDERAVDQRLVAHGKQVHAWQSAGEQLFGRAVHLLTDGPSAELTGPFAQSWQSAATQHRMEETLVRNRHLAVAGYLDHAYESLAPFTPAAGR